MTWINRNTGKCRFVYKIIKRRFDSYCVVTSSYRLIDETFVLMNAKKLEIERLYCNKILKTDAFCFHTLNTR